MSKHRITLRGVVEVESANELNDLLNNLEASAESDAEMTNITTFVDDAPTESGSEA
jgi:hypothetical protein